MAQSETIYENNGVEIKLVHVHEHEYKININDKTMIWVSSDTVDEFKRELVELFDKHRI